MKIFGICLVKNEADVISWSFQKNIRWFDRIYVLDNGSEDSTWERVQEIAAANGNIVAVDQLKRPFRDGLRSVAFNQFRKSATVNDWWCRLDGDEIYPSDPRETLSKIKHYHHVVWSHHLNFYMTEKDVERLETDITEAVPEFHDGMYPKYYACNFAEPRFFRHRHRLVWDETMSWPRYVGVESPLTIVVHHLQYRSAQQISFRLKTRNKAAEEGYLHFKKDVGVLDWRNKVWDSKQLIEYDGSSTLSDTRRVTKLTSKRLLKIVGHVTGLLP